MMQLAVRHVDDAHQAVGDRQAQRREQQDAAEADAAEDAADHLAGGEPALDRAQRFFRFAAHLGVGLDVAAALLLEHAEQQRLGGRIAALGERADAAMRVARSLLASWMDACVSASSSLISGSLSCARAFEIAGSMSSSAPLCSSLAAARRVAGPARRASGPRCAVPSSLRTRLLTTTSSRVRRQRAHRLAGQQVRRHLAVDQQHLVLARRSARCRRAAPAAAAAPADRRSTQRADRLDLRIALAEGELRGSSLERWRRSRLPPARCRQPPDTSAALRR